MPEAGAWNEGASGARGRGGGLRREEHPFESGPTIGGKIRSRAKATRKRSRSQGTKKIITQSGDGSGHPSFTSAKQHDRRRRPLPFGAIVGRSGWLTLGTTRQKKTRRPPPRPRRERPRGAIWRGSEASRQSRPSRPSDRPTNTHARAEARCLPQGACDRRQRAAAVECRTALMLAFANHRQAYDADHHKNAQICPDSQPAAPP